MEKVIIETPYAGNVRENVKYARKCLRDSLLRGEAPIASHLLYTQDNVLNDLVPEERAQGINAGLAWQEVADLQVFYIDHGYSKGMLYAKMKAEEMGIPTEERQLPPELMFDTKKMASTPIEKKLSTIEAVVCSYYNVSPEGFRGSRQNGNIPRARQFYCYLAVTILRIGYKDISEWSGISKNMVAINTKKITELKTVDSWIAKGINTITNTLEPILL